MAFEVEGNGPASTPAAKTIPEASGAGAKAEGSTDPGMALLLELLELAPAAIGLLTGPEHRLAFANRTFVERAGRKSAAELLGKTLREALPEIQGQGLFEVLDDVYRTGEPFSDQERKVVVGPALVS